MEETVDVKLFNLGLYSAFVKSAPAPLTVDLCSLRLYWLTDLCLLFKLDRCMSYSTVGTRSMIY